MDIYKSTATTDLLITVSPLEYKRLYEIIEDHACEYGSKGDIIFKMLESMEKFNNKKGDDNYGNGS